jgi:hypothetical protein
MGYLASDDMPRDLLVDDAGKSLSGSCSHCRRLVDNHDENHRVSAIMLGGRGVECVVRCDIHPSKAMPLGRYGGGDVVRTCNDGPTCNEVAHQEVRR